MALSSSTAIMEVARDESSLNVLVVDADESSCLALEKVLHDCNHTVTKCKDDEQCIQMIRENGGSFHMVIIDADVSAIGGIKLCKLVREVTTLPIILTSSTYSNVEDVQKALDHGACDFLLKPIKVDAIRKIDMEKLRTRSLKRCGLLRQESVSGDEDQEDRDTHPDSRDSVESLKALHESDAVNNNNNASGMPPLPPRKRQRTIWTTELHAKFVSVVNRHGIKEAVPKKILEAMNVPGLTRENIASHLQKYRLSLKKKLGETTQIQEHIYLPRKGKQNKQSEHNTNDRAGAVNGSPHPISESPGFVLQGPIDALTYGGKMTSNVNQSSANNEFYSFPLRFMSDANGLLNQPTEPERYPEEVHPEELSILYPEDYIEQDYEGGGNNSMYMNYSSPFNNAIAPIYCDPAANSASTPSFHDPAAYSASTSILHDPVSFHDPEAYSASTPIFHDPASFHDPEAYSASTLSLHDPAAYSASTPSLHDPAAYSASTPSLHDPAETFSDDPINVTVTKLLNKFGL